MAFPPHIAAHLAVLDRAAAAIDAVIAAADRAGRDRAAVLAPLDDLPAPAPVVVVVVVFAVPAEPDDDAPDAPAQH